MTAINAAHNNIPPLQFQKAPPNNGQVQQPVNPPIQPQAAVPVLDPGANAALRGGAGPNLNPQGQGARFAANHNVGQGRDHDVTSAKGVFEMSHKSAVRVKELTSGKEVLDALNRDVTESVNLFFKDHPDPALVQELSKFKKILALLRTERKKLADGIMDGSGHEEDPRAGIAEIRKTLRVFRYEMQKALSANNIAAGDMERLEGGLRGIQNKFTSGISHHVESQNISDISLIEDRLLGKLVDIKNRIHAADPNARQPAIPKNIHLADTVGDILELSHRTNDRIRGFQDADYSTAALRDVLKGMEKGGSRKVEFSAGAGVLISLGLSESFTLGARPGTRFRVVGEISKTSGGAFAVTFRVALGLEAKAMAKLGTESLVGSLKKKAAAARGESSDSLGGKSMVSGGGEVSHITTRTYASIDDLLLDSKRCGFALSRSPYSAALYGLKSFASGIGRLGTRLFRWMGRRSDEIKQNNSGYLAMLKKRGIIGQMDQFLARRANPMIVSERKGWVLRGEGVVELGGSVGSLISGSLSVGGGAERELYVESQTFAPFARTLSTAADENALVGLLRPGADGGAAPQLPGYQNVHDVSEAFDQLIREKLDEKPKNDEEWANFANTIRTLQIKTEILARKGQISRAEADRLLARFSNPKIAIPPDIFREYLMDGTGAAKPAKIRKNFDLAIQASVFKGKTGGLTKGIANPFLKTIASGAMNEGRRQIGADFSVGYSYSSEAPAHPGKDPRPWENVKKTKHELSFSPSTPLRYILDRIARSKIEHKTGAPPTEVGVVKPTVKAAADDVALEIIPGLLVESAKKGAKAAVMAYLASPENVRKVVDFVLEHSDAAIDFLGDVIAYNSDHPDELLETSFDSVAYIAGTDFTSKNERLKILSWTYEDGEFASFSLGSKTTNKLGLNVDPMGMGLGLGFDVSYKITESSTDYAMCPKPSLVSMLGKTEDFLFSDLSLKKPGNSEAFKNFLARNRAGVDYMLGTLQDKDNEKNREIFIRAMDACKDDVELHVALNTTYTAVLHLAQNAKPDDRVEAARKFLVAMTCAFRSALPS